MGGVEPRDLRACATSLVGVTREHRSKFQAFTSVYEEIRNTVLCCEKRLLKTLESPDCLSEPASLLCRNTLEQVHAIASVFGDESLHEMHRMNAAAKEKLERVDHTLKADFGKMKGLCVELNKLDTKFAKIQSDARIIHSKTLDYSERIPNAPLNPQSEASVSICHPRSWVSRFIKKPATRDQLFTNLQVIRHERERVANESERIYSEFISHHTVAYNRLHQTVDELASMRRRMNRKILSELRQVSSKCRVREAAHTHHSMEKLEHVCPTTGDFNMRLPDAVSSLNFLVGKDRENRVRMMACTSDSDIIEHRAIQTYLAREEGELSFTRNERIEIIKKEPSGWWYGRNSKGQEGVFPSVLVAPRPAGAPLPVIHNAKNISYRPGIAQETFGGTWKSNGAPDDRMALIESNPEFCFVGVIHFPFFSKEICLDVNDIVQIARSDGTTNVIVQNVRKQQGSVPLNIMTVKEGSVENENISNFQ